LDWDWSSDFVVDWDLPGNAKVIYLFKCGGREKKKGVRRRN